MKLKALILTAVAAGAMTALAIVAYEPFTPKSNPCPNCWLTLDPENQLFQLHLEPSVEWSGAPPQLMSISLNSSRSGESILPFSPFLDLTCRDLQIPAESVTLAPGFGGLTTAHARWNIGGDSGTWPIDTSPGLLCADLAAVDPGH